MATDSQSRYSFQMKQTSYKSQDLINKESGYQLVIYSETCYSDEFYWGGVYESFEVWTVPAGEPILQEKREQIIERINDWSRTKKTPINIGPSVTKEEQVANFERHGYSILHLSDKSYVAYPSDSEPPAVIKEEEVADYKTRGWTVEAISGSPNSYVAFAPNANASSKPDSFLTRVMIWLNSR